MLAMALLTLAALGGSDVEVDAPPDAERLARLAEYHARRDGASPGVADQFALAEWCEQHGLRDEATAHYTVVTRLEPKRVTAWTRLGYRKYEGSWRSEDQITRIEADRRDREQADARYRPWLASWRDWLKSGGDREKAVKTLATVNDPLAVSSIRKVFSPPGSGHQAVAVAMLSGIDANEATIELARLAVDGRSPGTRKAAGSALDTRDPRVYVGYLINRIREPVHFEVLEGTDGKSAGELLVEEPDVIVDRVYDLPSQANLPARRAERITKLDSTGKRRGFLREYRPSLASVERNAQDGLASVEKQLTHDVRLKELENLAIDRSNARVLPLLYRATGQQLGASRELWTNWWTNQLGYTYQSRPATPEPKPVVVTHVQPAAPPPVIVATFDTRLGTTHHSCFAAGTVVRTETGSRPIESLSVGDLVLARSTRTGSLSYRPIVATFHNPPSATLRLDIGSESIVATPIHRFWKVGVGWTMARDLQPGDPIHLLSGESTITAIRSDAVQNVFNLEVLGDHDFFVGQGGALVHDNSLVHPALHPFDAKAETPAISGLPRRPEKAAIPGQSIGTSPEPIAVSSGPPLQTAPAPGPER